MRCEVDAISKLEFLLEKIADLFDRIGTCGGVLQNGGAVRHAGLWIRGNFLGGRFWIVSVIQAQDMAVAQVDHHVAFGET